MKRRDFLRYGAIGLVAAAPVLRKGGTNSAARASEIVRCVIHPAIGIARVGNSPNEYFLGPEAPGPHPIVPGGFKDDMGRLKRQAARFRIYGLDADGNVVKEVTAADAEITWTVHLANSKAAWYNFETAFDIPEATGQPVTPDAPAGTPLVVPRRNAAITGAARGQLVIDPGPRSVGGSEAMQMEPRAAIVSIRAASSIRRCIWVRCGQTKRAGCWCWVARGCQSRRRRGRGRAPSPTTMAGMTTRRMDLWRRPFGSVTA